MTLNVVTLSGMTKEIVDVLERRKIDVGVSCVQVNIGVHKGSTLS